ncbi:MAG: hypothetical protein V3U86_00555 [Acidobacteriota bacterium]
MSRRRPGGQVPRAPSHSAVLVQIPLALLEQLWDVREGFFAVCIETGQQVLQAMW